jgi:hypothetical protein
MLDFSHVGVQNQQTFTATAANHWQSWNKPRGITLIHFFVLGGGGGGAGGRTPLDSGNGSGGTSAGQSSFIFPAWCIPDTLYILVGTGGAGGVASGAGANGTASFVAIYPLTTANYILCQAQGSTGGLTNGNAPTPPSAVGIASSPLAGLGFPAWGHAATTVSLSGQAGSTSTARTAGTTLNLPTTGLVVTGGSGAGGNPQTAGNAGVRGGNFSAISESGPFRENNGGVLNGGAGSNGFKPIPDLMYNYGGTGGGSGARNAGTTGGPGGPGHYGCGGGGGGGAQGTPAAGGNGGDGLVIVTWR